MKHPASAVGFGSLEFGFIRNPLTLHPGLRAQGFQSLLPRKVVVWGLGVRVGLGPWRAQ